MLMLFLAGGTLLMFGVMLLAGQKNRLPWWKLLISSVVLAAAGVLGARLLYLLENGVWGGISFYGAVFLPPLIMLPAALLLKLPPAQLMDLCAPAECVMLALLKVQCLVEGCCGGRVIGFSSRTGEPIVFPSQIAECVNALVLMVILILLIRGGKKKGLAYPAYMILYGVTRFFLNLLRETTPFILGLAAGNFWSLVSIVIGLIAWFAVRKKQSSMETSSEGA